MDMTVIFTTVTEYALRALTHLATHGGNGPVQVKEIAEAEDLPRHFLAKILNRLAYQGLVRAHRGPGGGFLLTKQAEAISVADVVESIDGLDPIRRRCVLGLEKCSDEKPCPLHQSWKHYRETFLTEVSGITLAAMSETLLRKRSRPRR